MTVPKNIREEVRDKLWAEADQLTWASLSATEKSQQYTIWTGSREIGGRLSAFMDPRQVRVYIKDTLLKAYTRKNLGDVALVLRVLCLPEDTEYREIYIKPHGRMLSDGRIFVWSKASDWKLTLLALHERAFEKKNATPYAAVLMQASTKHSGITSRLVVEDAAAKLNIKDVIWLD